MRYVASVEEVRAAEAGHDEAVLIDRASTAVARRAVAMLGGTYGARVLVAAGPGHNGADALWAGWKLAQRGAAVDVVLPLGEPRDEHGAEPLRRLLRGGARLRRADVAYDLAIDGVLGVGARMPAEPDPADGVVVPEPPPWFGLFRGDPVLAVDVPTGVDAATGEVAPHAVRAAATVTFGALKPGLVLGRGAEHAGLVEVAPIGLGLDRRAGWTGYAPADGTWLLGAEEVAWYLTTDTDTDKFRRGVVGVVAGSEAYPGAAALACRGAQRAGCGYVRLHAPRAVADAVRAAFPEVVAVPLEEELKPAGAWVVGPGLGADAGDVVARVLATRAPVVIDADGLRGLGRLDREVPTVLTPHTGEFERLTGVNRYDAERDRLGVARRAAADLDCTVLLKGATTVVASPRGAAYVNPTGTPWLGTAGTGDVLAGVIGAFLSRDRDAAKAAAAGAWLHGLAGRLAAGSPDVAVTALDVAEALPEAARIALRPC